MYLELPRITCLGVICADAVVVSHLTSGEKQYANGLGLSVSSHTYPVLQHYLYRWYDGDICHRDRYSSIYQ